MKEDQSLILIPVGESTEKTNDLQLESLCKSTEEYVLFTIFPFLYLFSPLFSSSFSFAPLIAIGRITECTETVAIL